MSSAHQNSLAFFTEQDIQSQISMADAITAVEKALQAEAKQAAETLPKYVLPYQQGQSALHVLGAVAPGLGISGVKTWVQSGATAHPVLMVFDSQTTQPLALIEANVLSNLRTGALAGVATKYLAKTQASVLGIIGSGKQARTLAQAVAAVRALQKIVVWSPNKDNRAAFAYDMQALLEIPVLAANSAQEALAEADIIGLAARVPEPVISADMLAKGAHINSIGTTVSGKAELPLAAFPRFSIICADSVASVQASADEFRQYFDAKTIKEKVLPLADIVAQPPARSLDTDLTVYKGMGTGVADLALASFMIDKMGLRR